MQMNITFRQFGASDSLKEYAREKVDRVNRLLDRAGEAHVVLSLERHLHHADITIHSGSWVLRGREKSEDMYASIDLAMDKIERQLRRYKDKLKTHHGKDRVHHRQGLVNQLTQVRHAIFHPPETTRAFFRGRAVARFNQAISSIQWDGLSFRAEGVELDVALPHPVHHAHLDRVNEIIRTAGDFRRFAERLREAR